MVFMWMFGGQSKELESMRDSLLTKEVSMEVGHCYFWCNIMTTAITPAFTLYGVRDSKKLGNDPYGRNNGLEYTNDADVEGADKKSNMTYIPKHTVLVTYDARWMEVCNYLPP